MTDHNNPLHALVRNRLVRALVVVTLLLLIVMEGVQVYRSVIGAKTEATNLERAKAETATAKQHSDFMTKPLPGATLTEEEVQRMACAANLRPRSKCPQP